MTSKDFDTPETIEQSLRQEGTVYPDEIETPNYAYGRNQEQLDYNTALRNKPASGIQIYKPGAWIQRNSSEGTGTTAITGVGFTPKLIKITAIHRVDDGNWSEGSSSGDTGTCIYIENGSSRKKPGSEDVNIIRVYDTASLNQTIASVTSLDTDGFTLNFTVSDVAIRYIYECYG